MGRSRAKTSLILTDGRVLINKITHNERTKRLQTRLILVFSFIYTLFSAASPNQVFYNTKVVKFNAGATSGISGGRGAGRRGRRLCVSAGVTP